MEGDTTKNQSSSKTTRRKILSSLLAVVFAATMVLGNVSTAYASSYTWAAPTKPLTVDSKKVITVAAHRAAQTAPEILGADMAATSNIGGAHNGVTDGFNDAGEPTTLAGGQATPMLGIFGSNVNENPDPYYYNYFYNLYADAHNLAKSSDSVLVIPVMQSPAAADTDVIESYGTSTSLYRRPDILLGDSGSQGYNALIAALPENKDADAANNYNPYQVTYNMKSTYDMANDLKTIAADMVKINKATGKTWRYDNPVTIADNYEKYIKGLSAYVCSKIADGTVHRKKVAVIDATSATVNGDGTFKAFLSTTSSGTAANCRGAEYLNECTTNIAATEGKTSGSGLYLTANQLMSCDDIIICGAQTSSVASVESLKDALIKYGTNVTESKIPPIMSANPDCVYGITMNSAENGIGFGYYIGYVYPEILNPVYASAYFYEKFLHVTDQSSLQSAISANFENASLPSKVTTALTNYNSKDIDAKLTEGMDYYQRHQSVFKGTALEGWNIDWANGIGTQKVAKTITNVNSYYTVPVSTKLFTLKPRVNGNVIYKSNNNNVVTVGKTNGVVTIKGVGLTSITITSPATNGYKAAVKTIAINVIPNKINLNSLSSKSQKMMISWTKDKSVNGYEILYSTDKTFRHYGYVMVKGNSITYRVVGNFGKGRTNYVKVRSYKTVNGKTIYGVYSNVGGVKIK